LTLLALPVEPISPPEFIFTAPKSFSLLYTTTLTAWADGQSKKEKYNNVRLLGRFAKGLLYHGTWHI
jgi:hypothetical protein